MAQELNDLRYNIALACKVGYHASVIAKHSMAHEGMEVAQAQPNNAQGTIVDSLEDLVTSNESSNQDFNVLHAQNVVENFGIYVVVPCDKVTLAVVPYLVAFQNETIGDYPLVVLGATSN